MSSGSDPDRPGATWDDTAVEELRELQAPGEPDLVAELVGDFVRDAEALLPRLESACRCGDVDEAGDLAHRIKGSAASLGALRLASAAQKLEAAARRPDAAALADLAALLHVEWRRFLARVAASTRPKA